jgi:DNA/RNA endonuclease YhcR with UshA esterase domain
MLRLTLLFLIAFPGFALAEKPDGPAAISVADAAKKVNEKVTVEMVVGSTGSSGTKKFLNSEKNFRDDKNFSIMIDMSKAGDKFKELKIEDPLKHFGEETIRVTGTVTEFKGPPEIVVTDPDQIKIVEKK